MTNESAKRRTWIAATAAIIAVALALSCAFAAFLYTRTGVTQGGGNIAEGDSDANEQYTTPVYSYGEPTDSYGGEYYPITNYDELIGFIGGTTTSLAYGKLMNDITITSTPSTGLILGTGRTLDGNGFTVQANHEPHDSPRTASYSGNEAIVGVDKATASGWFSYAKRGSDATATVAGNTTVGLSDLVAVNYGTIKNLTVTVGGSVERIYVAPADNNNNVSMGVIAGINAAGGVISNCKVEVNQYYGFIGSYYNVQRIYRWIPPVYRFDKGAISTQGLVSVGGVSGSNLGIIADTQVTLNNNLGVFRQYMNFRGEEIPNDSIGTGAAGGVTGINDGGTISGIDLNISANGAVYNNTWHTSTSYTGGIVGLANLTSQSQSYTVNGASRSVGAGVIQNVSLNIDANAKAVSEAYYYSGGRNESGSISSNTYVATGNPTGVLTGTAANEGTSLSRVINVLYNPTYANRGYFRNYASTELNQTLAFSDGNMPLLGKGTNITAQINHFTFNAYLAGSTAYGSNATAAELLGSSYSWVWNTRINGNSVQSGLLVNMDVKTAYASTLGGNSPIFYRTYTIANGSTIYDESADSSATDGLKYASWTETDPQYSHFDIYSEYKLVNFVGTASLNGFTAQDPSGNEGYAYAHKVYLTQSFTLDNSANAARVLHGWKTIDGGLNQINVTGFNNTSVSVDGINAMSDFIAVNRGKILSLSIAYPNARGTVSAGGTTAFGFVAGVNYGTISHAVITTSAVELRGNDVNSLLYLGGAVGYNCGQMSGVTLNTAGDMTVSGSAKQTFLGGAIGANNGGGTLQTAAMNGGYDVTVQATASATYGNYVGGFIGAGVNSGTVSTEGNVLTLTSTAADPFGNWLFAGKQRIQASANSYTGLFAGLITASPNYNATDNPYITGLVAAAPDLDQAVGWFTQQKGVMSLAGYATGATGESGKYVATDLILGQIYTVQDASDAFVSKALTNVYWDPSSNIYRFTVESKASSANWALTPYGDIDPEAASSETFVNYGTPYDQGEIFDTLWDYSAARYDGDQAVASYTFDTGMYRQNNDETVNPDYLAPVIGVKLTYRINLQSGVSAGDATNVDDALTLFLSGNSSGFEHMNPANAYKAVSAGASGAYADNSGEPWTVSGSRNIVFDKPYGLDGSHLGGMKINVSGNSSEISQVWDEQSQSYVSAEFIAVNNSYISFVNITVDGGRTYSAGDDLIYSHLVGVNNGTVNSCSVTVSGNVSLSATGEAVYGSFVGINNGTVSSATATHGGSVSVSGGGVSYAGGAIGINRGVADGTRVAYDGGAITAENAGGILAVLGGAIGLQDSAGLADVQTTGYGATFTVYGSGAVGGVVGAANAGNDGNTVVSGLISATPTVLSDIANAVYGIKINAENGYIGLISATLGEGEIRSGALSGIAAFYPEEVEDYTVPWTTSQTGVVSMYGYNAQGAGSLEGILFRVSDYSKDGAAEFLTDRGITVNGSAKSFTFDASQITGLKSITFDAKYYYYDDGGVLTTDGSYSGAPVQSGNIYTTSIDGTYANNATYVPVLDVLADYSVTINNGENQRLVDFMRGEGEGAYAGAHTAEPTSGEAFSLDGTTSAQRGESLKDKVLSGSGNTISVSGALPTASYDGITVSGGFFAVNRATVSGINVVSTQNVSLTADAFGMFAGVNEGALTNVSAEMKGLGISGGIFGAIAGINKAEGSGLKAILSGVYTVTAEKVFAGGAFGENSGAISNVVVEFSNAALTANPTSTAATGGVIGKQNGGSLTDVGTSGGTASMSVTSGTGYIGGVVGIINTGAADAAVAGEDLSPSSMNGVYDGAYTSSMNGGANVYKGLIAGAVGSIASGKITSAAANYRENAESSEDYTIPWFSQDSSVVSMYGYNQDGADISNAVGVLFRIGDHSDDGAADFVNTRTLVSGADGAEYTFSLDEFSGAYDLNIKTVRYSYGGGTLSSVELGSGNYTASGTFVFNASNADINGTGDFVPAIEFFATYSVDIRSGTEYNLYVNEADGIMNSMLYCFIDGAGNNQLYAGAKIGYIKENLTIYKPANGYVTMSADKVLEGGGNTLRFAYNGGYVLEQDNIGQDNAASGGGGYVPEQVNGSEIGAAGGLIAVNNGVIRDINIAIRTDSYLLTSYSAVFSANAAFGMLVGVNRGSISGISFDNSTQNSLITVSGTGTSDVIYGGIVGINAEEGEINTLTVNKYSAVNIDNAAEALYGGVIGQNYGEASAIILNNFSANTIGQVEKGVYGGAVGSNNGTLSDVNVTVGTEIAQSDYLSRLGKKPEQRTIYINANLISVWGGVVGYNAGSVTTATLKANVNYGISAGAGNVSAGGVIGMNDGGSLVGLNATGWGGFYVYSSMINSSARASVFVGGLVGSMNADGASKVGFISFANTTNATISDSVFALSGGMVTMYSDGYGNSRYGYVTGALAESYAAIPSGAVKDTFWFISDKLSGVEGEDAEVLPAFHGGSAQYPTYISVFGKAPSDWLISGNSSNEAQFATGSYGFNLVDSDDNPINYLTMDAEVSGGTLTLTVHKPSGVMFVSTPDFASEVTGSGGTGIGTVGAGGGQEQTLTVSNAGNTGVGYLTFSFESSVYALTDSAYSAYTQYMMISFLSTMPFGTVEGSSFGDYYSYTTVDGEQSRSIGDAVYRVYQVWSGATEMRVKGNNKTIEINDVPSRPLILGEGKTFNGGQNNGIVINVNASFQNNIALYTFGGDLDGVEQTYLVVSEFLAINYGTFTNAHVNITGTDGHDIYRNATDVIANAPNAGIDLDVSKLSGFIYGMLVGVNEGVVSELGGYSFDRKIELNGNAGAKYNSIFGGMIGAVSGENALVKDIGDISFGTSDRAGSLTMTGSADLVAAGGVVGIVIGGKVQNLGVTLTANSTISVEATHNAAAVGGVIGDLRGNLSDVIFESEYQSEMKISGTNSNGIAALANLAGIINSFSETSLASIERVKVTGVGYLYNGIDENGTVTTSSINLYTAGVVAMGANYGNVDEESVAAMADGEQKEKARQVVDSYGVIIPAKLESVYVDFEGYVRAKANTNVGIISARLLNGVTEQAQNINKDLISNLIWQISYEGDTAWTTSENYADYTDSFNTNEAVAILGYAPYAINAKTPDMSDVGMRIWLTNNLYTSRLTSADVVLRWIANGKLNATVSGNMNWQQMERSLVYYKENATGESSSYGEISSEATSGTSSSETFDIDVSAMLSKMSASQETFPSGIYMIRLTYNEVYIYNQRELIAFFSLPTAYDNIDGSGGNQYYSEVDGIIGAWTGEHGTKDEYRNANIGILAQNIEINYGLVRVTMSPDKILEGNGMTVTFNESGTLATKRLTSDTNDKNYSLLMPAGVMGAASEYDPNYVYGGQNASFARYIGGTNVLSEYNIDTINTGEGKVGVRVGGMFVGRNLGTIQNINFVVPQSVSMTNEHYGTFTLTGIVCAVNAGTIDNCSVTVNDNVKVGTYRETATSKSTSNEVDINVVSNPWINTAAVSGGIAGLQYGTSENPSYISNCTVTLGSGSEFRTESQVSSFYWLSRHDNVYAYAGGIVGWLTSDSTVYNATINGTGTITAWGELNMGGSGSGWSSGRKVTCAGAIVGLNSDHQTYSMSQNTDEYGLVDGVICNWNGAAYFLSTSDYNIYYSSSGKVNYYVGAQLAGIAEQNTLKNIYFMYGIEQYRTFHRDNWYYGNTTEQRMENSEFADKYEYIVSQSEKILKDGNSGYTAMMAFFSYTPNSSSQDQVVVEAIATKSGNSVEINPNFTLQNYANYTSAWDTNIMSGYGCGVNFGIYGLRNDTWENAMSYYPRITETMDSSGKKELDFVGARAAAMMTTDGTADWNNLFKPNNVYIYEVGFGSSLDESTELDMNDPDTSAYLSFQTKNIVSDVAVNISLSSDSLGAQFVWEIREQWKYKDGSSSENVLTYYDNVTSLEQAKQNTNFSRIFDRDNDGADYTFTYVMGLAVKIAMDTGRYYYDETEGVFYDSIAKIYDGNQIEDPELYYADEDGNAINRPDLGLGTVSAELMSPEYYRDNADGTTTVKVSKSATDKAGAYRIRITFSAEGGENSKVNTTNRTIMFSDFDYIDIYTVVLPRGVTPANVSVSKTYDGTTAYNDSITDFGANQVPSDKVALNTGYYSTANAGSGMIFTANFTTYSFFYINNGVKNSVTINLFEGDFDTANYAPASAPISSSSVTITPEALEGYTLPSSRYGGEIFRKQISLGDVDLDMFGGEFIEGGVNPPLEYNAMTTYDTKAFQSGSTVLSRSLTLTADSLGLLMKGYANNEEIEFFISFLASGDSVYQTSVKNYGTYTVYLNIVDSGNFILYENSKETERMSVGQLSITPYEIQTANVTYVIDAGYLSKIFDNDKTIPFSFNPDNLRIVAQGGYEVQPDEYTLTVGAMYTTAKGGSSSVDAKDAGEYDIYFRISNFNCTLGNYILADMTVSFVDSSGRKISYFVLPKEIVLSEVTKEFDNTTDADPSDTVFGYQGDNKPVDGTNDKFDIEYADIDAGAGINVSFRNTSVLTLNGTRYNTISVVAGANIGKQNYYAASLTSAKGNITPVLVNVESVTMVYNNKEYVDYRKEGTSVVLKNTSGAIVNIYPSASFDNKSAGQNKTVRFDTTSQTIAGTRYNMLVNSAYVSTPSDTTGVGFAGNYYMTQTQWSGKGEIVKNTLSLADIGGKITIMQTDGSAVIAGSEYLFENAAGRSYTYHYGYEVGFEVAKNAFVLEDDLLSNHLEVVITNTTNTVNGYVGRYTLELVIVSNDYDWDEDVSEADRRIDDFNVEQQTLGVSNLTATLPEYVLRYQSNTTRTTLDPTLIVTDADGRKITEDDGLRISMSTYLTNTNEYFSANRYTNGSVLDVGDYYFSVTPIFDGADAINYSFYGQGRRIDFSVLPYTITSIVATKEFDNNTSFDTAGNEAEFKMTAGDPFTPDGVYSSKQAGSGKSLSLVYVVTTINGQNYELLKDASGRVTNNTYTGNAIGFINAYSISPSELRSYILGWVKDVNDRQRLSLDGSAVLEYRSDAASGYKSEHFLFETTGMNYGFTTSQAATSVMIMQNGYAVETLNFTITLSGSGNYTYRPGDDVSSYILPAGVYTVTLSLSSTNFVLEATTGRGQFTVEKQEISGGGAEGSANVFITLDSDFAYTYGESGFNMPAVDDAKFAYTMNIIDKYTGKISATFTGEDAVIGRIEYTTSADSTDYITSLTGPVYVGGYYVWASSFSKDVIANYSIPENARIAVYTAGTAVPEAPDPEEGEEGGSSGEGGDGTVVIPSLAAEQAYFILPRTLNIAAVAKTYDGNDSFSGAVLESDAISSDGLTAESLSGVYASPNANYDSTGTVYIDGNKGSDYLLINVVTVNVNGIDYYVLSSDGLTANYSINGELNGSVMTVTGAKIMRKAVDATAVSLTSDTFEKVYGSETDPVMPDVTATFGDTTEIVAYAAENVVYKQGGEVVEDPTQVGGYEMYLKNIAFDNYEVTGGLSEVLVNAGRAVITDEEGESGGQGGDEGSGEGEEPKQETYTYYIVPQEVVISGVVKFYDRSAELNYYGEEETGVSAEVILTDAEGNEILDSEGNPLKLRLQGRMADASSGKNKDVYADFTPFGYYVNFDEADAVMYYRLLVVGEDGTANVASNYCISASESVILPVQFDEGYVPEDPEKDDTPVINNGLVYNMTLVGAGTVIPSPLGIEGIEKVYDGTFAIVNGTLTGFLAGDEGMTAANWRYDDKNVGTSKAVGIETDGTVYTYDGVDYYAIYMNVGGEKVLSDYGVAAAGTADVEETVVGEDGEESVVTVTYAIAEGAGTITPYELTAQNFSGVNVAGIVNNSVEFSSSRTYDVSEIRATLSALGFSAAALNNNGTLTVTFANGDALTFIATLGGAASAHDAGTYPIQITLTGGGNYQMSAPYTTDFVITKQSIKNVYVVTGAFEKTYDGTGDLPQYVKDGWAVYAIDNQGAVVDMTTFGDIDLSTAQIAFVRENADGEKEYFYPVNVAPYPGYAVYVNGIELDGANYVFTSSEDAVGCSVFDGETGSFEQAYYMINPYVVTVEDGAFDSKKFDGAFSLRTEGVQGETVVIGDRNGINASLAGVYGTLSITPYVSGVSVSDEALNQQSTAANYVLYYDGAEVSDATVIEITDYTVTRADILVAERSGGKYVVAISGLQGLDFLFAKTADITDEARERITSRLLTGETWTGGSFDSSSDFAKLNQAVFSVLSLYVNNGDSAVTPSVAERYAADNFVYIDQGGEHVLTFEFAGVDGYDETTATDRYTFAVKGNSDALNSTNYSSTSSELESGQLGGGQGAGIAVSTAEEFVEAVKNNSTFYLVNGIYGIDMSGVQTAFSGRLDGRGYAVSFTGGAANDGNAAGMLAAVNNGVIENLTVKLMPSGEIDAVYAGGLVGINNGTISNVSVELMSDFIATNATQAGGVAGMNGVDALMQKVSFVYSASVNAVNAGWGAITGDNLGSLVKVAVRVNESIGAAVSTVSAANNGLIAGSSTGSADGVIVAVKSGNLGLSDALWAGGTTQATNVYSYMQISGAAGGALSLLDPYTEGYIGYYFATAQDYTTGDVRHNELTSSGEYNKSYYVDYTGGAEGYIAVEAIAPHNRFVWDGYGISYRTAFADGNVGSSLNRIVALFAQGDVAAQFEGTTVITGGVDAFTVAIGVRGGTVDVEGDVETSVKEVVYTGVTQVYKVNITVTTGGVSETKELFVSGTDAGYYSKASLEGIIGDGAGGETIGDVTYDSGSRTEYTFSGEGSTVASGIALVIYPKQTNADSVAASKYYDTSTEGTIKVADGEVEAGTVAGNYYDASGNITSQVADAEKFGFATFSVLTRKVLAKDGVLYGIVEKTDDEGKKFYETQPITLGNGEEAVDFTTSAVINDLNVRDLMIAYSRLADEDYARSLLTADQLTGFEFVTVYNLTANITADAENVATVSGGAVMRPVIIGESGKNYALYSAAWSVPEGMTVGADEATFALEESDMTVNGSIVPVDLGVTAQYTVGRDQSYNAAMLDPEAVADRTVSVTREQAAEMGISSENYDRLVQEVQAGLSVTFAANFYDGLVTDGVLEKRADGKYYVTSAYAKYSSAELPSKADGGNFVITMADNTVTFRYFGTTLKDGAAFYTLTGADDYAMWIENEAGTADYYAIDMLLVADIDFGGKLTDMLAWRDADGNVVGYKGTFDGNGKALTNMLIIRSGSAALFERIDEGAVVKDLTVADTVIAATGAGSAAGGIAVDNYGSVENCAFEGVLSASSKTGGIAAVNYGDILGGISVNRAYVGADGNAEGIAENADDGSGNTGTADGVSITESVSGSGESAVENTAIENADGTAAEWNEEAFVPVITAYVFDETYVKVDNDGKFITDNFFKLNAVDKLFGWVGAAAVTHSSQTGFYGVLNLK